MRNKEFNPTDIYSMFDESNKKPLIDIIRERRSTLDITNIQLSNILSIDKSTLDRLLNRLENGDVKSVDFYQIIKIAQFFKIDIKELSQYYVSSLSPTIIRELEITRAGSYIVENFDIEGLKRIGFISNKNDIKAIEEKIKSFFNLSKIEDYDKIESYTPLFSKTRHSEDDKMKLFWIKSAIYQFSKISNPNEYNKDGLLALIPKIRPYTRFEKDGFRTVIQALFNIGVTVIVQPYLTKTSVRGATFIVDDKPCVVITDFNKTYATIWFALLHELFHVLYDFDELKTWKYHLSNDKSPELTLFREKYANFFAMQILFSEKKLEFAKSIIKSPSLIEQYAKENQIHPSIIYSFYCYEEKEKGKNFYPIYQKYFGNPDKLLKQVKTNPYTKESIQSELEHIKQILEPIEK